MPPQQTKSLPQRKESKPKSKTSQTVLFDNWGPASSSTRTFARTPSASSTTNGANKKLPLVRPSVPTPARPPTTLSPAKGKTRAKVEDERLWVDRYSPQTQSDLAVHKKKVEEVQHWLREALESGPNKKLQKYRRILALTGPAGCGKTATLKILLKEMNTSLIEWSNTEEDDYHEADYDTMMHKFQQFISRASSLGSLMNRSGSTSQTNQPHAILIEDLPNLLHQETLEAFHETLDTFLDSAPAVPLIIIVSDTITRGESKDELGWGGKSEVIDIRRVLPPSILNSAYVRQIRFNPIAPTLMKPGLNRLLDLQFRNATNRRPSKEAVDAIIEASNGDIRSAIMSLEFACVINIPSGQGKKTKTKVANVLEAVTSREQSLALFHLLGKVLHNKRVGDPVAEAKSKKQVERERYLDSLVPKPPKLPRHLQEYERNASRVDPNVIYAESPVDTSLYSLYIHQNYTQFCEELDECDGIADALSLIDVNSEIWENRPQVAAEHFHTLTLSTLLSLPSPVPRRLRKIFKPDYFEQYRKTRDASDAVGDVLYWLSAQHSRGWTRQDIPLRLGTILHQWDRANVFGRIPPSNHRNFSHLPFRLGPGAGAETLEDDEVDEGGQPLVDSPRLGPHRGTDLPAEEKPFWLAEDDII